jgi:hypothetical protein
MSCTHHQRTMTLSVGKIDTPLLTVTGSGCNAELPRTYVEENP